MEPLSAQPRDEIFTPAALDESIHFQKGIAAVPSEDQRPYARFPRRLLAMLADGALLFGGLIGTALMLGLLFLGLAINLGVEVSEQTFTFVGIGVMAVILLGCLLYEPVLVSRRGGTFGHKWFNLHVVPDEEDGFLAFRWAFVRTVVKGLLGLPSFVLMALTSRSQALHDVISGSTVQIKDVARAKPSHFRVDRPAHEVSDVSRVRRATAILLYMPLLWGAEYLLGRVAFSEACRVAGECTIADTGVSIGLNLLILFAGGLIVYLGWVGRLPGARSARPR